MPDLTERILLQAEDFATALFKEFGSVLNGTATTLAEVSDVAGIADEYLASLADSAFTTGVGFDGLTDSVAISITSLDALDASLVEADAAIDSTTTSLTAMDTSLTETVAAADGAAASVAAAGTVFDATAATTSNAKNAVRDFAGTLATVGAVAGIATGAVGILTTKMAGDFGSEITSLSTGAGELQSNLKMVGDGVLQTAKDTGEGTKQLTDALYLIDSSGQKGAQSLKTLHDVAEGAKVGVADMGDVASGATTIMTDYADQNITSAQSVNALIATVSAGKTHMDVLSQSLAKVLPTASAMHVGLTDVMSAMATMTGESVAASDAATYLRQTIMALSAPSKQTSDALNSIGLTTQQVSDGLKTSLPNTLNMIMDALGKKFPEGSVEYQKALTNIAGGSKQMQGILALTGSHMNTFAQNFGNIDNAVTGSGNTITGFSQVQKDFNFQMDQAKEGVETFGIKLGQQLMPIISQLMTNIGPAIASFGDWVMQSGVLTTAFSILSTTISTLVSWISNTAHFFQQNQAALELLKIALIAVSGAIAGYLIGSLILSIPALITFAGAAWLAITPLLPFIAIMAAVALVIYGIVLAVQHWGQIVDWLKGVWGNVAGFFQMIWGGILVGLHAVGAFFVNIWNGIVSGLHAAWDAIVNIVRIGVMVLLAIIFAPIIAIAALFIWLYQHNIYFKLMIDSIVKLVKTGIAMLVNAWQMVVNWLIGLWQMVAKSATEQWNLISGTIHAAIQFVQGIIMAVWTFISGWITDRWNELATSAKNAWALVSGVFSSIWDKYLYPPLKSVWDMLNGWFKTLADGALSAGKSFINMLVEGIKSGAGAIWNVVKDSASIIWKSLGFHSPTEEGPGSDADEWMPNLIKMLSSGLEAGAPQMEAAAVAVARPIASTLGGNGTIGLLSSKSGNTGGNIYISINIDGRSARTDQDLLDMLMDKLNRQLNRSGSIAPWISGGKA